MNRSTQASVRLLSALGLALAITACEGSEVRRTFTADVTAPPDVPDGDAPDGADVEGGSIDFQILTAGGPRGLGEDEVALVPADELGDYLLTLGFQIDVEVRATGFEDGAEVELLIDDVAVAPAVAIELGEDDVGVATFRGLTIPTDRNGVTLRASGRDATGAMRTADKQVTLDVGQCDLELAFPEIDAQCLGTEVRDGQVGVPVTATLLEGRCQTLKVEWTLDADGIAGGTLPDATFDENGVIELFVALGMASETFQGTLTVTGTAVHDDADPNGDDTVELTSAIDSRPSALTWVSPDPVQTPVLGFADDVAPGTDGVQVAFVVAVDDAAEVELLVQGAVVETVSADEAGEVAFAPATLPSGEVEVVVRATDDCGNVATLTATFEVLEAIGVTLVTPADEATLLAVSDADPSTASIYEATWEVSAAGVEVGTTITILCKPTLQDESVDFTAIGETIVAEVAEDGRYDVDIAVDALEPIALTCVARLASPEAESDEIAVTLAFPGPRLALTEPLAGACLTTKDVPVAGTAVGLRGREVEYTIGAQTGVVGSVADASGEAPFAGTIQLAANAVDGAYTLSVDATDAYGNVVSDTQGPTEVGFVLDTTQPILAMTQPAGTTIGPEGDTAPGTPGFQTTVIASLSDANALGGSVCLAIDGGTRSCRDVTGATVSFEDITLVAGANLLTLTGEDACGNVAPEVMRLVTLEIDNPLTVVTPLDGATLLAAGDGDPATARVYELDVVVEATNIDQGSPLVVECRATGAVPFTTVGQITTGPAPIDHHYIVAVALDTDVLGTSVVCRARATLPAASTSDEIELVVGLPAPALSISTPAADACLTTRSFTVAGSSSALVGRVVTLSGATGSATVAAGGGWTTTASVTEDGPVALGASANDDFGNPASATPVAVLVDATSPTLALQGPTSPINPDDSPDADPVTPGYQTTLTLVMTDTNAIGGELCYALGAATPQCATVPAGGVVGFTGVTLQPGDNALTISGADRCGNAASAATSTLVLLETGDLTVVITAPAADLVTAGTQLDVVVAVSDEDGAYPGATVTLEADGQPSGVTGVDQGDGSYLFEDVPLAEGVTTVFVARATSGLREGQSDPRSVTQKDALPAITITAPADGAVLNLASAACQAGQTPCISDVTATTTDVEDGSAATLTTDCEGDVATATGSVTAGGVTFEDVSLAHGGDCTLTIEVTDAAGQVAGDTVVVTVDRVAPTLNVTAPGAELTASDDLSAGEPGIQAALTVELAGVEAGQIASAVLTWTTGGNAQTKTVTHTVATDTPDDQIYVAAFEELDGSGWVTWPDGFVTVTVSVADAAGNAAQDVLNTGVNLGTVVRILGPADTADTCAGTCAVGVCQAGACYRTWGLGDTRRLVINLTGLLTTTQNARVCSDHPSLAGAPGAIVCASAPSATGSYHQVAIVNAINGNNNVDIPTQLTAGFQSLVVEAQAIPNGVWASSLGATAPTERVRRVLVDLTPPVVSGLVVLSDTLDPIGTLNIEEQLASGRQYQIRFTTSEAGLAEVFVNGGVVASQQVAAGEVTMTVTLPEGTVQLWVIITDVAANKSPAPAGGGPSLALTVDVTPPTLAFSRPNKATLNAADNLDVVLTTNTVDGQVVTVSDGGTVVASKPVAGGSVTFAHATSGILTNGSHTLTASIVDRAGNPASAATSPATVLVDTLPPSLSVTSPTQGQAFTDFDDADPAAAGFQLQIDFTSGDGAATWAIYVADACDATGAGCQPRELEASGTGAGALSRLVTLDVQAALSFFKVTVEVSDVAGNLVAAPVDISVLVTSCTIAFTNLPAGGWYNIANACPGATPCASADVPLTVEQVGVCPPINRLVLYDNGVEIDTINTNETTATFTLSVGDGDHFELEVKAFQGNNEVGSTGVRVRDADFVPPVVSFVSRAVNGFTTPAEGATVSYNTTNDLRPNTAGMQMHASIDVSDLNASGGQVTSIVSVGTSTVQLDPENLTLPSTFTGASPIAVDLLALTLTDLETQIVTVTANDVAGNAGIASFTATVDVTPPAEVPIISLAVQARRPRTQSFAYTQVGDNGNTGGPVAAYEIRYSRSPIDETNFASACSAHAPELLGSQALPSPGAPGTSVFRELGAPDTRPFSDPCKLDIVVQEPGISGQVWTYWAIRARDAAGNWSPITTQAVRAVTYGSFWLQVHTLSFNTSGGGWASNTVIEDLTYRGTSIGDIDEDGITDYAIGSWQARSFCVIKGKNYTANETITTPSGTHHRCLTTNIFTGSGNPFMGHEIAPLGDLNGDGIDDFGVTGRLGDHTAASLAAVAIYLGRIGELPDLSNPQIIVRGMLPNLTTLYSGLCSAGDFDGVLDGGVATSDFVVTAIPATAKNWLAVFPGRASWTPTMSQLVIDLSTDLDATIAAHGGLKIEWDERNNDGTPANGGSFGTRCAPAGDVLPTPGGLGTGTKADLIVSQTGIMDGRIFVIPGRAWAPGAIEVLTEDIAGIVTPSTAEDLRSVRLRQDNDTALKNGFGNALFGGVDLNNDTIPDIVVVNPNRSFDASTCTGSGCTPTLGDGKSIHIFDGSKIAAAAGLLAHRIGAPTAPASPPEDHIYVGTNGWIVRTSVGANPRSVRPITDFNDTLVLGRPSIDLVISNFLGNEASIRTNHFGGPKSFPLATFPVIDGVFENNVTTGTDSTGTWLDGGYDLSGDGRKDLIAGSRKGQLIIVR
ncbi:MAG: hypothetical protein IT385_00025 [Deltaproteobacteria bacterium]|nr:hypothetical protein [Deltaproteobacteria bacterium]